MPLRGPRFAGDPVLEQCFADQHRMMKPERGIAVMRVQSALQELGIDVGAAGADGIFGNDTGAAVRKYKQRRGLTPADAVVGPGTAKALDDDLYVDPPTLDPAFAEFSPAVVDRRVEPFIALELAPFALAPLSSWRHGLYQFALNRLASADLLGIVAVTRVRQDLQARYLAIAAALQDSVDATQYFTKLTVPADIGRTVSFDCVDGERRSLIWVNDDIIMGRGFVTSVRTGRRAPLTTRGVLMHELNHVRNLRTGDRALALIPDTDDTVYADTVLAQASTAAGPRPTGDVTRSFAREIAARHTHWILEQEEAGNPFAARFLPPANLVECVRFYAEDTSLFALNGYLAGIVAKGRGALYSQLGKWLTLCAALDFTDDSQENLRTQKLFRDAAAHAAQLALDPIVDLDVVALGVYPGPADFTLAAP